MSDYENISPDEASKLIAEKSCFVIDVRTPPEFQAHRVAGAYLLPMQELNQRHTEIPKAPKKKLLFICEHGVRSLRCCAALAEAGWEKCVNMSGGMAAWIDAGLPVVSGSGPDHEDLRPQ
jgi:rhodanese-related sulfurtransferase